jgi:hypothetical protein
VAHDVFISYSSKDKTVADAVCARLEAAGIRCWIAPRDVVAGRPYGEALFEAISGMKVMVLVFSSHANVSEHIPKEVERAVSRGVPILPFRIEDVAPGKSLDYFIGSVHWLDAMTAPMEKHLDDLAATVQKLLPANPEDAGKSPADRTDIFQRRGPANVPPAAPPAWPAAAAPQSPAAGPMGAGRAPASGGAAAAPGSKTIFFGVAAIAVIAAVVIGVILLRGGGKTESTAIGQPSSPPMGTVPATNPAPAPSSPSKTVGNPSSPSGTPSGPAAGSSLDTIVGCFSWTNNVPVVIRANGTLTGGGLSATWQMVSPAMRAYQITWPRSVDTVTIAPDQGTLAGANQYGVTVSACRMAGSRGFVGNWVWKYSIPVAVPTVVVNPNGTVLAGTATGSWRAVDAARGVFALTWSDPPRDMVALSPDGSTISGKNQWGVVVSAVRSGGCSGN